jgi:hypothetical protein
MTLGNMRELGVRRLVAYSLNPSCRHGGLIDVSKYSDDTEMLWFTKKSGVREMLRPRRHIDVRPNWKEQPPRESLTGKRWQ